MNEDISATAPTDSTRPDEAARAILEILATRREGASICPTEAARHVAMRRGEAGPDHWRRHLGAVRRAARHLAQSGEIDIMRKGKVIDPAEMRGVIRLRLNGSSSKNSEET